MRRFPQPLEEATGGVRFAGWRPAQFAAVTGHSGRSPGAALDFPAPAHGAPSPAPTAGDNKNRLAISLDPVILI
jgi:hypothetical protein